MSICQLRPSLQKKPSKTLNRPPKHSFLLNQLALLLLLQQVSPAYKKSSEASALLLFFLPARDLSMAHQNDPACQRPHHHHHTFAQTWPEIVYFCCGRVYNNDNFVTEFVSPTCTTPLAQVHVGGCCSFQEFQQVCQLLGAGESSC